MTLIASACVGQSGDGGLSKIRFDANAGPATVGKNLEVLFYDDEEKAFPSLGGVETEEECLAARAKAAGSREFTHSGGEIVISGSMDIRQNYPHVWYVMVAHQCSKNVGRQECPHVVRATTIFEHSDGDTSGEQCGSSPTALSTTAAEIEESLKNTYRATSLQALLDIPGFSTFGVAVLYIAFLLFLLLSLLFLFWAVRSPARKAGIFYNMFAVVAISTLAYLALATGYGVSVKRKLPSGFAGGHGGGWTWGESKLLTVESSDGFENPFYSREYAEAPIFSLLYARYVDWIVTAPLLIRALCLSAGATAGTTQYLMFAAVMFVGCLLVGSLMSTGVKYAFWFFGVLWLASIFGGSFRQLRTAINPYDPRSQRLFKSLMVVLGISWSLWALFWLLAEGTHAVSNSAQVAVYAIIDLCAHGVFGLVLLHARPTINPPRDSVPQPKIVVGDDGESGRDFTLPTTEHEDDDL
eukprot:CAMPEP_0114556290 /NCGR_PEP_ID=MMETSP0114-20121206/9216_1 /TAXON_ID=31324 /ORGANISM="Goniomonas sp, Strain m" /LENGTH=467 /DNA_ID=CAMNT_0001741497 /DNA_START=433 /DNA_END=1836 /DNA_ORIENTATION=+